MAITLISQPNELSTTANPNVWIFNSSNKTKKGFRYIVDFVDIATTKKKRFRVPPRPIDGYCFIDLSQVTEDLTRYEIDFDATTFNDYFKTSKTQVRYRVEVREEFGSAEWSYLDTIFINGMSTGLASNTAHTYVVGDTINLTPTNPLLRPSLNGLYQVVDLQYGVGGYSNVVVVSAPWQSTATNPGKTTYADNRKTISSILYTSSDKKSFKSAIKFNDWSKTALNDYSVATFKLMTDIPNNYHIGVNQDIFIPALHTGVNTIKIVPNVGATKTTTVTASVGDTTYFNINPHYVGVNYFDVSFVDGANISEVKRFYYDSSCMVTDYEILFIDRKGSVASFPMYARSEKSLDVTKETYNKPIEFDNNGEYKATNTQGQTTSTIIIDEKLKLRTQRLLRYEDYEYFEQVISSPLVYIKIKGDYFPCEIITGSLVSLNNNKLRFRELDIRLSNKNNIAQ